MGGVVKVLVVDDSAIVRQTMVEILESDTNIQVVGTAADPYIAAKKLLDVVPDVITLDVEMPRMDGITFLKKLMSQHPIPVVMVSSLTEKGSETTLKALEYGAADIIQKPRLGTKEYLEESKILICDAVKAAAKANVKKITNVRSVPPKLTADVVLSKSKNYAMLQTTEKIVAIGASTGGTEALKVLLEALPLDAPGIAIVQHMPENFTRAFAKRLDSTCRITVKEAENGDSLIPGRALIAPGNHHMLIKRSGARYYIEIKDGPLVCRHRPSVDVLFRSAARYVGKNGIGVIMTGMGDDGARGLLEMKDSGAKTIAQDKMSCVVFGMPNEAIKLGAADRVESLSLIPNAIIEYSSF